MTRTPRLLTALGLLAGAAATAVTGSGADAATTCGPAPGLSFSEPQYVDEHRAGGEPIVFTYPDGSILYGAHAGTTHFYTPAAGDPTSVSFVENYQGQTYYWYSTSNGTEWSFSERVSPPDNAPGTGFSDPEFAYDTAGNVYVSEINLVNVAVSRSTDAGQTYVLRNPTANAFTDRQWMEGDEEGVLYMVSNPTGPGGTFSKEQPQYQVNSGHTMYKSVDGGLTFTPGFQDGGGLGDIRVDKRNGTVYEAHLSGGELSIHAWRNARNEDFQTLVEPEMNVVFDDVHMLAHWPAFDLDDSGNLYITWDEDGTGELAAGIYYSYSDDEGRTWSPPLRVNTGTNTAIWPWLGVGDDGKVGIAWLEADVELPDNDAETPGDHGWRVIGATTVTGLGCASGARPSFSHAVMTPEPVHNGTICQGGTTCQATLTDRRLGDYFSVDIDATGMMYAGYSDTAQGGSISLPAFVRQNGGTRLIGNGTVTPPAPPTPPRPQTPPNVTPPKPAPTTGLPATGFGPVIPAIAVLLTAAAVMARRRRRTSS
jgi:hypothetical protein